MVEKKTLMVNYLNAFGIVTINLEQCAVNKLV